MATILINEMTPDEKKYGIYLVLAKTAEEIVQLSSTLSLSIPDTISYWQNQYDGDYEQDLMEMRLRPQLMDMLYDILHEMCFYRLGDVQPDDNVLRNWDEKLDYFVLARDIALNLNNEEMLN